MSFQTEEALNKHLDLCNTNDHIGMRTLHNDDYLKFNNFHHKNRVPFTITYDFECIIKNEKIPIIVVYKVKVIILIY